jgi:hypothetical protein
MHPLVEFASEANARGVCWRIGCTTCGASELRGGIRRLARGGSPQRPSWLEELGAAASPSALTPQEAGVLASVCSGAPLDRVARAASFPDWLGYLGFILWELTPYRNHRLRIGRAWSREFIRLGGQEETWMPFERRAMSWHDLEAAEQERIGTQDTSNR